MEKSKVEEFLNNTWFDKKDSSLRSCAKAHGYLISENGKWLNLFCNELELLLKRSKLLDEMMEYYKEKHKTEENG